MESNIKEMKSFPKNSKRDTFQLTSAIAVGLLLVGFVLTTLYVLFSSYASG